MFLQMCEKVFKVKGQDLFDPPDLFDVKNFRQVLHILLKLSKSELVEIPQRKGFPPNTRKHDDSEKDIYGNLQDMALEKDLPDNEELYDKVYQEDDEEMYEDLCSTRWRKTQRERGMAEKECQILLNQRQSKTVWKRSW